MSRKSKRSVTSTTRSTDANTAANFNPDYSHVLKDLRRIGMLAGVFVTVLVVLSFFLR